MDLIGIEQTTGDSSSKRRGLKIKRFFTDGITDPFDQVNWVVTDAVIMGASGKPVFEQRGVEFPDFYSQTAINVVASKYFRGELGTPEREYSLKQLITRVVDTITRWGMKDGYFATKEDADAFRDELKYITLNQLGVFNSPVWFNVGVEEKPQCSACFILKIEDTMESILETVKTEGMIFKYGSGSGINFSTLRSSKEKLSGGGVPSGPVSFMKGFDAFAGVIKSGGKTRRAAKMVILNVDHPDIVDFIESKAREEKKAWALIEEGYDGSFDGEAYASVFFQNANNSVRVTDEFMKAVETGGKWYTKAVTTGEIVDEYDARELMRRIAEGTHICGDPGLQFDTTINKWHTCKNSGRINASNPCSEFMFLDNSACNLASLNLLKFLDLNSWKFDIDAFKAAVRTLILAQEIIVDNSHYPTKEITENSKKFRPLGLGYANLGGLLMAYGVPYDSEEGRAFAAAVTSLMSGEAYAYSAEIAQVKGPFEEFELNRSPMLNVIKMHKEHATKIDSSALPEGLFDASIDAWNRAIELGIKYGYRNAQVSLLAPTGTIGFFMDCDTTGIEPDIALVKYKNLVGGGLIKIVNKTVPYALKRLGYTDKEIKDIMDYIHKNDTIEGAPHLKDRDLPVFDCAFRPTKGQRFIKPMGHVRMMAAVQPFLSGAISKTVNVPKETTVEEIMDIYMQAWKLGLKAVAIYRDGSKRTQPLTLSKDGGNKKEKEVKVVYKPIRKRLPDERKAITHKFTIAGLDGYVTVGMYDDGKPGEIFVVMSKQGSVISGLMDAFATAVSIGLQYGVPLEVFVNKFSHMRFEPSGFSGNPKIGYAKSIVDYIFRWLAYKFLPQQEAAEGADVVDLEEEAMESPMEKEGDSKVAVQTDLFVPQEDAPVCVECGSLMVRNGACYKCPNCGATSGCS